MEYKENYTKTFLIYHIHVNCTRTFSFFSVRYFVISFFPQKDQALFSLLAPQIKPSLE